MPKIIQNLFPGFVWQIPTKKKTLFLTFDDGPIPDVTPWVLDLLKTYNAKATFFCVGENLDKNPEIQERIISEGHLTGNHSHNHLNGWNTENISYFHNIRKCATKLHDSILFRPPYGKIKPKQVQFLLRHYRIVMWDVLSGDFDPKLSNEECLFNVINHSENGSIIVFHDSKKAFSKLKYTLPKVLDYFSNKGYQFDNLSCINTLIRNKRSLVVG